jgi:hypothetical protein
MSHPLGSAALTFASKVNALGDDALTLAGDINDELNRLTAAVDATTVALDAALGQVAERDKEIARLTGLLSTNRTRDLFGIRVFPHYANKNYGNHPVTLAYLKNLGVKRISGQINPDMTPAVLAFYRALIDDGCRLWLTVGVPHVPIGPAEWNQLEEHVAALGDGIDLLSGWNEPNHARAPKVLPKDWVAQTNSHQSELFRRFGARYRIGTPALWSGSQTKQFEALGKLDLAGKYHVITWHWYMRHDNPGLVLDTSALDVQEAEFRRVLGDTASTIVCTESGFFTAPNYVGTSNPVTEAQQAALIPQTAKWYVDRGYGFVYFELYDEPDPAGANREDWFGVVACPTNNPADWTKKPAYDAVKGMLT